MKLPDFKDYVPSDWSAQAKKTERPFFWAVLITLAADFVEHLVNDVR